MKKWKVGSLLSLSLVLTQLVVPITARAESVLEHCGVLEEQARAEIQREADKQFKSMKYQARNSALLDAIIKSGKEDKAVNAALAAMRGKPKLDNDTRLKYSDLLMTLLHEQKLVTPKALISCPAGYVVDESKLHTGLWQMEGPSGYSRQGLGEGGNISQACEPAVDPHYAPDSSVAPIEYTEVKSTLGDSTPLGAIEKDPALVAITYTNSPVTVKFRGKNLVLMNLSVMTYLHLKNSSVEEVTGTLYLHDHAAKIDGRDIDLEGYIDGEVLPKACKNLHSMGPNADGGGSTTGGIIDDSHQQNLDLGNSGREKSATLETAPGKVPAI